MKGVSVCVCYEGRTGRNVLLVPVVWVYACLCVWVCEVGVAPRSGPVGSPQSTDTPPSPLLCTFVSGYDFTS